jgi:hypothetical protein
MQPSNGSKKAAKSSQKAAKSKQTATAACAQKVQAATGLGMVSEPEGAALVCSLVLAQSD